MSQLREIRLYGPLAARFGRVHRLAVDSIAEALRALAANFPGFEQALRDHPHGFHLLAGREDRAAAERLDHPVGMAEQIRIVPATAASKGGLLQTILGAVLLVAAFVIPGAQFLASVGLGLILGGVAQMLTPTPKYETGSDEERKQSYAFSGPVNTSTQGTAVPVGYGRMIVGSAVLSMGISVEELPT